MTAASHPAAPDQSVWRVLGDPLLPATGSGVLDGLRVAVKDLFALEGFAVGAGNPGWLARATPETATAAAPAALLAAGAAIAGIARTDEFAYSLAGTNAHYGTPPNPQAPDRISGGSSSGSASAVSLGQADVGLGTDTGGSIRVPAAYQGLYGIRTSHGAVSTDGLLPLAPSFDTVGWMARDAGTLAAVGDVLLPRHSSAPYGSSEAQSGPSGKQSGPITAAWFSPALLALAESDVVYAAQDFLDGWAGTAGLPGLAATDFPVDELPHWLAAFQTVQGYEAWEQHGGWIGRHWESLGTDVAARFRAASLIAPDQAESARDTLRAARQQLRALVGCGLLVLPSASSVAPLVKDAELGGAAIEAVRRSTMQLTCIAGIAGLPAVNIPLATSAGLPCGVSIVGPVHRDADLLRLACRVSAHTATRPQQRKMIHA